MKLYYSPGACSLSPHIVLNEAGLKYEVEKVDTKTHQTEKGTDFYSINPKGYVPTLQLDDGQVLTEGPAIVQYIADQKPEANLAGKAGTIERARVQEWLNFITSEIHKGFSPLFRPTTPEEYKTIARENLNKRIAWLDKQLAGKQYLMGDKFTVADAYAFTVLRWGQYTKVDVAPYANVVAFMKRMEARPKVAEALKAEGLAK